MLEFPLSDAHRIQSARALMYRAGKVVPRRTLIESVWGFDREIEDNTLDAFVRLLRQKVDREGMPKLILTVRGIGYMIREEPAE